MDKHLKNGAKLYSLRKELEVAIDLAEIAGKAIQKIRAKGYKIHDKGGQLGPVTEADKAASELLLREMGQVFPNDLIISEEAPLPQGPSHANRIWFIDPIDGTKDFITGSNEWAVMLGLAINGSPSLGVVYQPDLDQLYYATKDKGAFLSTPNGIDRIRVKAITEPSEAVLIQSHSYWSPKTDKIAEQLGISKLLRQGSLGLKLGKIAEGSADLYFNFSGHCHLWDLCGPEIILQEAGGEVLLSSGQHIAYKADEMVISERFLAGNNVLVKKLVHLL